MQRPAIRNSDARRFLIQREIKNWIVTSVMKIDYNLREIRIETIFLAYLFMFHF
jgi:hypothetical protein